MKSYTLLIALFAYLGFGANAFAAQGLGLKCVGSTGPGGIKYWNLSRSF
jgi:hypothetical protein